MTDDETRSHELTGRRPGVLILYGSGGALLVLVGVAMVAAAADESANGLVFGAFVGAIGFLALALAVLEFRQVRRRPGASLTVGPDGTSATAVEAAAWVLPTAALAVSLVTGALLAFSVLAAVDGNWFLCVALLALGVVPGSLLVPLARGRVRAGGLYLRPEGVLYRRWASCWQVAWDDIAGVVPDEPLALVLRDGAHVERARTTRWGWKGDVRAPDGTLGVATRYLAEDPSVITFLLLAYRDRPDLRPQLGAPASLEWEILHGRR